MASSECAVIDTSQAGMEALIARIGGAELHRWHGVFGPVAFPPCSSHRRPLALIERPAPWATFFRMILDAYLCINPLARAYFA